MGEYERNASVNIAPEVLFDYLADVVNLRYLPRIASAKPGSGDEVHLTTEVDTDGDGRDEQVESDAWFTADQKAMRIEWGSEGRNDYHGALTVSGEGGVSKVAIRVHTLRVEGSDVEEGLEEALAGLTRSAEETSR